MFCSNSHVILLTPTLFIMSDLHIGHNVSFSEHFQQQHKCPQGMNNTSN